MQVAKNEPADRAKIFMPFDALKGFREALREKEKILVEKKELSPDDYEILSQKLMSLRKGMMVKVVYYENQEYIELEGLLSKIDEVSKTITIVQKKISIEDISALDWIEGRDVAAKL